MGMRHPRYALTEPLESEEMTGVRFEIEHVYARPRVEIDRRTTLRPDRRSIRGSCQ
jgi:hypothetical protein